MRLVLAIYRKGKAFVIPVGDTLGILALNSAISKHLAKRVSIENAIDMEAAETVVIDCIKNCMKTTVKENE